MYVYLHLSLIDTFKRMDLDVPYHCARVSIFSTLEGL